MEHTLGFQRMKENLLFISMTLGNLYFQGTSSGVLGCYSEICLDFKNILTSIHIFVQSYFKFPNCLAKYTLYKDLSIIIIKNRMYFIGLIFARKATAILYLSWHFYRNCKWKICHTDLFAFCIRQRHIFSAKWLLTLNLKSKITWS